MKKYFGILVVSLFVAFIAMFASPKNTYAVSGSYGCHWSDSDFCQPQDVGAVNGVSLGCNAGGGYTVGNTCSGSQYQSLNSCNIAGPFDCVASASITYQCSSSGSCEQCAAGQSCPYTSSSCDNKCTAAKFKCSSTGQCVQCSDPLDPSCSFASSNCGNSCQQAGTTGWSCESGSCAQVSGGPFSTFQACHNSCPGVNPRDNNKINGKCGETGIDTAIGCVPIGDQNSLIGFFLKWGIGIGGGIAFLLIIVAGFQIMTSRGDPNRLKAGQELMTSAIAGLLLLIFSVVILRIIGFDILRIIQFQ